MFLHNKLDKLHLRTMNKRPSPKVCGQAGPQWDSEHNTSSLKPEITDSVIHGYVIPTVTNLLSQKGLSPTLMLLLSRPRCLYYTDAQNFHILLHHRHFIIFWCEFIQNTLQADHERRFLIKWREQFVELNKKLFMRVRKRGCSQHIRLQCRTFLNKVMKGNKVVCPL